MLNSTIFVDGIRNFSSNIENWINKPTSEYPNQITLNFTSGKNGILDLNSPRAVHWADVLDQQIKAKKPVYVEIDQETEVITNVIIPKLFKVASFDTDEFGNLVVWLSPSMAAHFLIKSAPNFEKMKVKLEQAKNDDVEMWITETRDNHEIIDVRLPATPSSNPSDPAATPPPDPPVSEARALQIYNDMNATSCDPCNPSSDCLSFLYPDDGCWIRAHLMCYKMIADGEDPEKVWIYFNWPHYTPTVNHPNCQVPWGWHVAPTLTLNTTGNPKTVIDPSVSPFPESPSDWRARQGQPGATLSHSTWTHYIPETGPSQTEQNANTDLNYYRDKLKDRCLQYGPPPYSCTKRCFFVVDRNNFSDDEIEAMLHVSSPAVFDDAFYVIVDGYSPNDLGFTTATLQVTPSLSTVPNLTGVTLTVDRVDFEYPTFLNRKQRITWACKISFANINDFTTQRRQITLSATVSAESGSAFLYLIKQPNPYEIDGQTSWLSTDLRVFQIKTGQSKFGKTMASDPSDFITDVISNLNTGNTGGQTFENNISTNQQTSRLELSRQVSGVNVYNFAVAKVRYRALHTSATDVRVFFRLFPVATTSLEYTQATTYRQHTSGNRVVPLLGIKNNEIASIPCFAAQRINSATFSMTTQTDTANVQVIPPDATGAEVVRYFGCWLDINQTDAHFPIQPSNDGPFTSNRKSVNELIRNAHQCLVSEIAFTPAPAQGGSKPSTSDKLAQRNLAIVETTNPGIISSRRIPQTFEIRPSLSRIENDELMIDWGNVPEGSYATIYMPGLDANDIMLLAAQKFRSYGLARIDKHTLKCDATGITYLPIPFVDGNLPGIITINLPKGIKTGQVFKVVVKQITGEQYRLELTHISHSTGSSKPQGVRHIVGSFQITIPVQEKKEVLVKEQRLLSNLRWIERSIPPTNRWYPVFGKYVSEIAGRVDGLGGNSKQIGPSIDGEGTKAYRLCRTWSFISILLIIFFFLALAFTGGGLMTGLGVLIIAIVAYLVNYWKKTCRPSMCKLILTLIAGAGISVAILLVFGLISGFSPQLIRTILLSGAVAVLALIGGWIRRCF